MNDSDKIEWIDDCFRIEQSPWKTYKSYNRDNQELITSLTEDNCIAATRFYLKGLQDGF